MFHNQNTITEDAIFIADSHYNKSRTSLEVLLNKIYSNEIKTSQVFLMGDMFDFLSYEIDYFRKINQNIINLINNISLSKEVIYLEGNHDFNISKLFSNVKVISRNNQCSIFEYNKKKTYISHGDIYTPLGYDIFTAVLRNKYLLTFLNFIDINNIISKAIENKLMAKNICHDFDNFNEFAQTRIDKYKIDEKELIIEGHFHQGRIYKNYINIPSLACGNEYMQIVNNKFEVKVL